MSIEAMSAVLHHANINPAAKLVLLGIANHEGDQGAYPAIDTLAKYANISHRSVTRHISELKTKGYIEVAEQAGRNGVNIYWVTVSCPDECDRTTNHRPRTAVSYPRTNQVTTQDTSVLPPRTTVSYKPSYNLNKPLSEKDKKIQLAYMADQRAKREQEAAAITQSMNEARRHAVDSPTCTHGKSLVLCSTCCKQYATTN